MSMSKAFTMTETKLARIAWLSGKDPTRTFDMVMHHINEASLVECFEKICSTKAKGISNISRKKYGEHLQRNLSDLMTRMKTMRYRPKPVKRVIIPKDNGKARALGISVFEDKLVQKMTQRILESIYEPIFKDCSYGFRPKRSCHDAIKALHQHLFRHNIETIIDVDLSDFFNTIDHDILLDILRLKIKDCVFLRYIVRMLKAGVLTNGEFSMSEEGVAQGSICSPVLSNIFAHYVIDLWFSNVVPKYCQGDVKIFRYADDIVICCEFEDDANKVKEAFVNRLEKYKLKLNVEKTKMVQFCSQKYKAGQKQESFDFLGFTFYLGKSKGQRVIPKLKTKKKSFRAKLKRVKEWILQIKDKHDLHGIWFVFAAKLRGHIQYYGVSFNGQHVQSFIHEAVWIVFKGLNRRSQKKSFSWEKFYQFMKKHPLPKAKTTVRLF